MNGEDEEFAHGANDTPIAIGCKTAQHRRIPPYCQFATQTVLLAQGKVSKSSIMVGDRSVDMIAAHRNALKAAGVLWGYGSLAELSNEMPVRLFSSPSELVELVNGRGESALNLCDRT